MKSQSWRPDATLAYANWHRNGTFMSMLRGKPAREIPRHILCRVTVHSRLVTYLLLKRDTSLVHETLTVGRLHPFIRTAQPSTMYACTLDWSFDHHV